MRLSGTDGIMIIRDLPYNKNVSTGLPDLKSNAVIWAHTENKYYYPEHKTPYLFISNFRNKGNYVINQKHVEVSDKHFYFLNANDDLEIRFPEDNTLQTLFILFTDRFIKECFTYFNVKKETLIDLPNLVTNNTIYLPNVPFEFSTNIKQKTGELLQCNLKEDIDQMLFELLLEFYSLSADTNKKLNSIRAIKKSTREELYRRLFLAGELMNDLVYENISVERMAREVCLNKFHFISCFKELYQTTPHQYFRELKLQKALLLLQNNQLSVTEVCHQLGFESVGSFSYLFKKRYGIPPSDAASKK